MNSLRLGNIIMFCWLLSGCDTWDKWKNNIKSKYSNATKQHLDELFAAWALRNQ